jgi:hypothetical protein
VRNRLYGPVTDGELKDAVHTLLDRADGLSPSG